MQILYKRPPKRHANCKLQGPLSDGTTALRRCVAEPVYPMIRLRGRLDRLGNGWPWAADAAVCQSFPGKTKPEGRRIERI
jgi:hypothetical protein